MPIEFKSLVGSQGVPYIYEDYVSNETIANAMMSLFNLTPEEKKELNKKVKEYAKTQFAMEDTVSEWDRTMYECLQEFKNEYKPWRCEEL